ncbi:lamin tail domain-containing protein [Streptomyces sp. NPDC056227]|uniref:lamin tail domain-containing protein n=1 Tax=Streptomyces sp. NPDC056227 TaxID=3345753 RepID=UPI0035D82917
MKLRLRALTGVLAAALTLATLTIAPAANAAASVPSQGSPTQLDVGNWNVEWFGAPDFGPTNEALQQQNVHDVMAGADMDVWGLSEVVSTSAFDTLVAGMPGYTGVVANDPIVTNGAQYYSDFSNTEQKVALVWRSSMATLVSAKVILTDQNSNFAGRPPVEFTLRGTFDGVTRDLVFIVLHAKSGSTQDAWNLRNPASQALKSYLDTTYPAQNVQTSTAVNPTVTYASAGTYAVSLTVTDNGGATHTTTQNVTVTAGGGGGPANVIINEVLANEPGSSTAGEAIEIVNTGGTAISIAGWTVQDGSAVRHTFAAGTTLQPGKAITVFGAGSAIPGGIVAVAASTGGLNLSNSGDQVILRDSAGATVQSMSYSSSQANSDGVSINRSPDGSATGGWVKHNTISSLSRSPGQRANGTVY